MPLARLSASRNRTRTAIRRVVHLHVLIGNPGGAQRSAKVLLAMVELLLHRARDVDLVDEVDAAAKVEAELQRTQAQVAHPLRHARSLRQRNGELVGLRLGNHVARLQLVLLAAEAQRQAALIQECPARRDTLGLEQLLDARAIGRRDDRAVARQLQRTLLAEQIRQREQDPDHEHDRDQHDLPARI